tara:strand:+ start:467 stop:706 length:240 start_codon:yes stop_codon:yes gene_type:complete
MASKFFYVVDHFESFPSSEYGGLWNVIADNDEECFDLIVEESAFAEKYYSNLRQNIEKATIFTLGEESGTSRIVEYFIT